MRARNERNSAIFGGTMGLLRRSALEEVGGWDEWCITEDAEASLRLYAAGYQGVYVHESYGRGIMPLTFDALKRQRFRWCFGGMQLLRRHARLLLPGRRADHDALSPGQRLDFLVGGLQWAADLVALGSALVLVGTALTLVTGGHVGFRPLGGPALALPLVLAVTGGVRAAWALRALERIPLRRAVLALGVWMALSLTVAQAVVRGLVQRHGVFLRTPKWRHHGGLLDALRATRVESAVAAIVLGAAVVAAACGSPLLAALGAWQGMGYAAAPIMAWLNRHADLSAKLRRRQRSEERRERLAPYEAGLARVAAVVVVAGCLAVVVLIARYPGDGTSVELPERPADDAGPLANMGVAPGIGADADKPAKPVPSEGTPVAGGTPAEADADGTSSTVEATTTTRAPASTVPPGPSHTTPGATRPTQPERPSPGGGTPPTRPSGR